MGSKAPERACVLKVEIGGNTRADILSALNDIYDGVNDGRVNAVCGSPSFGYSLTYSESARPTPDEYRQQLRAYIDSQRAGMETPAALDMSDQPMGDPHPADLTRNGQCPVCGCEHGYHRWNCSLNQD